ncbi:uncharacterized protein LOC106442489 [Brassica napus]|uniref:uncharacterized protein LOC106442489 n=1 Tax=Brassica napus TaxID=3708 RepID=UPI00207A5791|nr:uncharacterized protein LOC106442489 [Brassica napus]
MKFGCILETRVKEKKAEKILSSEFRDWSAITNYEHSGGGRIWLLWRERVCMTPVFKTDQLITCSVVLQDEEEFLCSFVYASNEVEGRKVLWEDLCHHSNSPMFRNKAWMIMGDFNEILEGDEHSGFSNLASLPNGMGDFQQMVLHCQLSDMGYQGPKLTWCNKREEGLICKKLDRVLLNDVALHRFTGAYSVFEPGGCSDHMRCKIQLIQPKEKIQRPFKYVNAIGRLPNFLPMIHAYWDSTEKMFHSTSAMYRFSKKLKNLKPLIRDLGREKLGNLSKISEEAHVILCEKQKLTLSAPSTEAIQEEAEAYEKWLHVAELEEDFLKQKSKLHWLEVGDQNNMNFYNSIRTRQAQNTMREIKCPDGSVAKSHSEIKTEAERGLEAEVSAEEVKGVLFAMPSYKSPGPDGFSSEFYKTAWSVIGEDFRVAVQSVFKMSFLPKGVNSTILALIPKKTKALEMRDYRPIACCNMIYKVVSKILANRLKVILPRIILANQSAFVKGRLFMENVLLASEIVKDYHKDSISPRCAMKLDISKAFDSVQWYFLLNCLAVMGFPSKFIHWIRLCVTSPSFSVQVNGDLAGYFQTARDKKFALHPGCQSIALTHLCFADDLMVYVEGTKESVEGVLLVFDEFAVWSGLSISLEKSTIYLAGTAEGEKRRILTDFPFAEGELPVRYLGLPLLTQAMKNKTIYLSLRRSEVVFPPGRAIFSSMRAGAFRLPSSCIKEIEQLCSAFLWTGPQLKSTGAKVAWTEVCKPKSEGGLGIRPLKEVNQVYGLKLIWRMFTGKSLWGKWIQTKLLKTKSFWEISGKTQAGSWIWRKILKLREVAKSFHTKAVGNGRHTSFWYDKWSGLSVLSDLLGDRGTIVMGIRKAATVEDAFQSLQRKRRHRGSVPNDIVKELEIIKAKQLNDAEDVDLWRWSSGFKPKFSTRETWTLLREPTAQCPWERSVWFPQATPKFSFMTWIAMRDKLSTMDRVASWSQGVDTTCVLCKSVPETRNHLFFECSFSSKIWDHLTKGILQHSYTQDWAGIVGLVSDSRMVKKKLFCLRYAFQAALYTLWRERNKRRHGEQGTPIQVLKKLLDKAVRNKLSIVQTKDLKGLDGLLQFWFETRM